MRGAEDVTLAIESGCDAVGAILAPASPRCVSHDALRAIAAAASATRAVPPARPILKVAVLADTPPESIALARELGFRFQFSGGEPLDYVREVARGEQYFGVVHVAADGTFDRERYARFRDDPKATPMFDTKIDGRNGGSGVPFAWGPLAKIARPRTFAVAGGLRADNVAACIFALLPLLVDVASGIETDGRKDPEKMRRFAWAVSAADQQITDREYWRKRGRTGPFDELQR